LGAPPFEPHAARVDDCEVAGLATAVFAGG